MDNLFILRIRELGGTQGRAWLREGQEDQVSLPGIKQRLVGSPHIGLVTTLTELLWLLRGEGLEYCVLGYYVVQAYILKCFREKLMPPQF